MNKLRGHSLTNLPELYRHQGSSTADCFMAELLHRSCVDVAYVTVAKILAFLEPLYPSCMASSCCADCLSGKAQIGEDVKNRRTVGHLETDDV